MRKAILLYIALVISFSAFAQSDDLIYCFNQQQNTINIDFKKVGNYYERLHLLYNINNDDRFLVSSSDENGLFYIAANDENLADSLLEETFVSFLNEKNEEFHSFDKIEISGKENIWKLGIPDRDMVSLTLDYMIDISPKGDNYLCINAEPFCTDDGTYTFSAMTGYDHNAESGPDYDCLSSQPCPSWYYMRIANPGSFVIHMEGKDGHTTRDIDFCCWGPFDDPAEPCPLGLTGDKVVDCSYSGSYSEDCDIPSSAQTGEYYILLITNWSKETCIITFAKNALSGPGTTDCSIMPPIIDAINPCYGETMQLTAQDVNNASYAWTGPNGFVSNVREPSISNVTFANSGTYTCVMTIPGQGSSEPISIDVEILPTLNANFDIEDPCNGGFVKFIGLETTNPPDHNDKITEYRWNFGDGTDDELGQNIEHRYAAPGTYIVHYTVIAENEAGGTCEDEFVKAITIGFGGEMRYEDVICYGEDYNKHGFHYTRPRPGTIYDTIIKPATYGCDSTITLRLIVGNVYDTQIFDTVCFGEIYKAHEFFLDSLPLGDTVVSKQDVSQYGCDSIITLYLNVAPTYSFEVTDSICYGDDYNNYGFRIPRPDVGFDTYTNYFTTKQRCDSIWKLNLYVHPTYDLEFRGQICEGEDFHEFGFDTIRPPVGKHVIQKDLKTLSGCDSIRTLTLFVGKVYDTIIHDSICYGNDYNQNGFNIRQPAVGMTYDTLFLKTTLKCDSIIYLELRVDPIYDIDLFDTICLGEEYHGYNFDTIPIKAGFILMEKSLLTVNGCDSLVKLNLTVNETFITNLTDTICFGENYTKHGFNIENPGIGTRLDTLGGKTIFGCDSILCLELYVAPVFDTTFFDTICFGNSYHGHGFDIDSTTLEVGFNYDTLFLQSVCLCDSVVKLELYVAPVYDTTFYDTICYGEEYHLHGFNLDSLEVGMKYDTLFLQSIFTCDSVVMLELYVAPVYDTNFFDTICYGNSYHEHGFNIENPNVGLRFDTLFLHSKIGCDSVVKLELYVAPVYDTTFFDTICFGERYRKHGFELDSLPTGWNFDTLFLNTICNCDSTVKLELYVAPIHDTTFYDTICFGEDYHLHGFEIYRPRVGMKYDTLFLQSIFTCDSTVMLELYVAPVYDTNFFDTICHGNSYHEHGFNIENPNVGLRFDTLFLHSQIGCDSVVKLELYVAPVYDTTFFDTICFGQRYRNHGFELDSLPTGWNFDTLFLNTICNCDSTVKLELYVAPIHDTTFYDTICYGDEYHEHGFDYDSIGIGMKYDTLFLQTLLNCDSTVMLELYVAPSYHTHYYDTITLGEDYHGHGFDTIQPEPGLCLMQREYFTTLGCDSIFTMHLMVGSTYFVNLTDTSCYGERYTEYGFDLDSLEVGIHHDTLFLKSILGRDSVVMMELTVVPSYLIGFTDTICYMQSYHGHGFDIDSTELEVGLNYDTLFLFTTLECDSIITLELYVAPLYNVDLYDTICHGEEYHQHGFHIIETSPGWNLDTIYLYSKIGCDSTVVMHLYAGKTYDPHFTDTICYGQPYYQHGFSLDSLEVGFHHDTLYLQTTLGCDSIVSLELYVAPVYDTTFFDTICHGYSYYEHGFEVENPDLGLNQRTRYLSTTLWCDSIVRLELYVAPVYDIELFDTICYGEDYHEYNFDTINPAAGMCIMQQQLTTLTGCDSIVTMNLLVGEVYNVNFTDTICYGEDYHEHGFDFEDPEVGFHHDTLFLQSVLSCDSTVMLELYVAPVYDTTFFDTICFGESYYEHGFELENLPVGWDYETMELSTTLGCDSIVNLELYVAPTYNIDLFDTICYGEDYHEYNFDTIHPAVGMCVMQQEILTLIGCDSIVTMHLLVGEVYDVNINDTICYGEDYHEYGFNLIAPEVGYHHDTLFLHSILGCDSTSMLELYVAPTYLFNYSDTICYGESYYEHGFEIENPAQGLGTHWLNFTTVCGCDSVLRLDLYVAPVYDINLYDTICFGEDYHEHGFNFEAPEPGMHFDYKYLSTAIGCDSTVVMNLLVGDVYDYTINDTICFGENYNKYNFHLNAPEVGIHTDVQSLSSIHSCDSVVRLRLFVAPVYQTDVIDSICEGEDYTKYGLHLIEPEPGVYDLTATLETQYGCDSIFDVNLKVINKFVAPELIHGMSEVVVATDMITGIYHYTIDTIPGCKNYRWKISNVPWEITQDKNECTILVTCPGTGTITVEAGNSCGDVSQSLEIHAGYFGVGENETTEVNIYPNPTRGIINIESSSIEVVNVLSVTGVVVKTFKFDRENIISIDLNELPNALYVVEIVTSEGKCMKRITKSGH